MIKRFCTTLEHPWLILWLISPFSLFSLSCSSSSSPSSFVSSISCVFVSLSHFCITWWIQFSNVVWKRLIITILPDLQPSNFHSSVVCRLTRSIFSRGHATLHLAVSVGRQVPWSVRHIFEFCAVFALLLLPNHPPLDCRVSGLVFYIILYQSFYLQVSGLIRSLFVSWRYLFTFHWEKKQTKSILGSCCMEPSGQGNIAKKMYFLKQQDGLQSDSPQGEDNKAVCWRP